MININCALATTPTAPREIAISSSLMSLSRYQQQQQREYEKNIALKQQQQHQQQHSHALAPHHHHQDHPCLFTSSQQSQIISNISHHLFHLISTHSPSPSPCSSEESTEIENLFNEISSPLLSDSISVDLISQYLSQILQDTQLEFECLIIALIYLDRLLSSPSSSSCPSAPPAPAPLPIHHKNWRNLLATCALLASKAHDDFGMSNADFRWVFPQQDLAIVNLLELQVLHLLRFQITIPLSVYDSSVARYLSSPSSLCSSSCCSPLPEEQRKQELEEAEEEGQQQQEEEDELLQEVSVEEEEIDSLMCDSYMLTDSDSHHDHHPTPQPPEEERETAEEEEGRGRRFLSCLQSHLSSCLKRIPLPLTLTQTGLSSNEGEGTSSMRRRRRSAKRSKVHCCDD
jgi:hypothetical protein